MWSDIIIGEIPKNRICTAINHPVYKFLSSNREAFWVSDLILGLEMTVYRNTPEGQSITELLSYQHAPAHVKSVLDIMALRHVDPLGLIEKIQSYGEDKIREGKRIKVQEFRDLLVI